LKELMTVGKIWYEAERADDGQRRWDLVIFDAPATGHSLQYLRMPRAAHDAFGAGLVGRESQRIVDLLTDPRRTAVNLITTAEEMPVNETLEMYRQIRGEIGMPLGVLFVNRMHQCAFTHADLDAVERQLGCVADEAERALLREAVSRGREEVGWSAINAMYAAQLRREVDMPCVEIPFAFVEEFGAQQVQAIATAIAPAVMRGVRRAQGNARA
jgi:anion-transporting  ArsA/GET3 family ATPase